MRDHWLTESASIHTWSIFCNSAASYFSFFCYLCFQQEIKLCVLANLLLLLVWLSNFLDSHRFTRCSLFFLIFPNTFLCNFIITFWLVILASCLLLFNYLVLGRLICFCIFKSSVLLFCRNSVFRCLPS